MCGPRVNFTLKPPVIFIPSGHAQTMVFKSAHPDIDLPAQLSVWEYLFESPRYSPLQKYGPGLLGGYTNAVTRARLNWAQVKDVATYISTALVKKYGLQEGETVLLFSQNTIWYPVTMLAATRAGGKICGASPAYGAEEMTHALKVADANFLFTVPDSIKIATEAAKNARIPLSRIFLIEGTLDGFTTLQDLMAIGKTFGSNGQSPYYHIPRGKVNGEICGFLCFSSGTTGLPKAVMLSHQNIIGQSLQLEQITPKSMTRILGVLPMFHITGLMRFCITPISLNFECYLLPQFSMPAMLTALTQYQIEEVKGVPPIMIRMVRDPLVSKYDLSCVKRFASGSAPMSEEIIGELQRRFPGRGFMQGYGMTETTACFSCHPPDKYDFKYAGTGGTLVANTEGKVVSEDGKELGVNEIGEILAKGPQIAMGYLGNEEATKESFDAEGFLHTGDIGRFDEEGFIHILDRRKELIKVKGIGVAPAELEDLLLGHVDVEDCAVIGVKDEYSGERPKAFVVVKPGIQGDERTGQLLMRYVREKKVRYKAVSEVEFIEAIPKSASGKILRRLLRDRKADSPSGSVVRERREQARL